MSETNGRYNADELHAPEWLNQDFFTKLLRNKEKDDKLKINKIQISPGTAKNDHYASIMFRAKIDYTKSCNGSGNNNISMIIKTTPIIEGQKKELLRNFKLFETEIKMYGNVLPKMERILKEHGDETKLCANLLYSSLDPHSCLIFEDLCENGYTTIKDRPSMEEVKAALLKLAKIHAISYKLGKEGDTVITSFKDGSFSNRRILDFPLVSSAIKTIKNVLAKHADLAVYVAHFEKVENEIIERIFKTFNAYENGERDGIFVLNHGDFHMKNMMIKENLNKLEDLMLVDFQISVFGSSTIDIQYAIVMLLSPEMRYKHRDELIYYYFNNFRKILKLIEFKGEIPTMMDFQLELLKNGHFELFLFISFLIFNYIFTDDDGDLGKGVEDENYRQQIFERPEVLKELRYFLPKYLHKGYFDY